MCQYSSRRVLLVMNYRPWVAVYVVRMISFSEALENLTSVSSMTQIWSRISYFYTSFPQLSVQFKVLTGYIVYRIFLFTLAPGTPNIRKEKFQKRDSS